MIDHPSDLVAVTSDIVCAYVAANSLPPADLARMIADVHKALVGLGSPQQEPSIQVPAVAVKKSITPDYLISLEDGRKFKTLKRYLGQLGMTPDDYRKKWGLPSDYPMVAPNYAAQRSELAKRFQLGQPRSKAAPAAPAQTKTSPKAKPKARSRKPKREPAQG